MGVGVELFFFKFGGKMVTHLSLEGRLGAGGPLAGGWSRIEQWFVVA